VSAGAAFSGYLLDLRKQGIALKYLDFGGGLGVRYTKEQPASRRAYARMVAKVVHPSEWSCCWNRGRSIIGGGILLSRVVYTRRIRANRLW